MMSVPVLVVWEFKVAEQSPVEAGPIRMSGSSILAQGRDWDYYAHCSDSLFSQFFGI